MIARRLIAEHRVRLPLILLGVLSSGSCWSACSRPPTTHARIERLRQRRDRVPAARPRSARGVGVARAGAPDLPGPVGAVRGVARGPVGGGRARGRHARADAGAARLAARYLGTHLALLVPGCMLWRGVRHRRRWPATTCSTRPVRRCSRRGCCSRRCSRRCCSCGRRRSPCSCRRTSERGRALSWVLGITIGMYAANFLLVLWEPTRDLARLTFFWYFSPGAHDPARRRRRGATWPCWQGGASPPRGRRSALPAKRSRLADAHCDSHRCRRQFGPPRWTAADPSRRTRLHGRGAPSPRPMPPSSSPPSVPP